jgi:hypothetical protein
MRGEGEPAGHRGQRQQQQPAQREAEAGGGQVVQAGHRPGADQRHGGEPGAGCHGQPGGAQHRSLRVATARQADQQAQAGQRQPGGDGHPPAGPAPPGQRPGGQHDHWCAADGEQGGQAHRGDRHGGEVAALEHRGEQAKHGDPGPRGPPGRPPPAGDQEVTDDQQPAGGQPVGGHRQPGQPSRPAEQGSGQPAGAPQQPGHDQVRHEKSLQRREGKGRGSGAARIRQESREEKKSARQLSRLGARRPAPRSVAGRRGDREQPVHPVSIPALGQPPGVTMPYSWIFR